MIQPLVRVLLSSICVIGTIVFAPLPADENIQSEIDEFAKAATTRETIPNQNIVILKLKNGMRIGLKKIDSEDDEMVVRLTALGGYSSLPESQRAAGQYAAQAAIRSGVGNYQFNQLHALLFDKSIEFNAEVLPFSRYIEGTAAMGDVETLLGLIHSFFIDQKLTEHSFKRVLDKAKEQLQFRSKNSSRYYDDAYIEFNNPKFPALKPLTGKDIDQANYQTAVKFFKNSFYDPSEFSCVIAGQFDMEQMIALIEKHLATIPQPVKKQTEVRIPDFPPMEKGIHSKSIKNIRNTGDSITTLTFPIQVAITEENYIPVENITQIIYSKLKEVLKNRFKNDQIIINVTTEYPLYPCNCATIKIQYFSDPKKTTGFTQAVFGELKKFQSELISDEDLASMIRKYKKAQYLHEKDESYWLMMLSNNLLWNWDLKLLTKNLEPLSDKEAIRKAFKTYISLENYTVFTAQP